MNLGVGGISSVELLILYELWAGERLSLEKAHPRYLRPGRPISVSAVPFGPGIGIWRSCHFIGAMMRSLCLQSLWTSSYCVGEVWSWTNFETTGECFGFFLNELLRLFKILLVLLVLCLLVLFLFGIVLLVSPVEPLRWGCLCLARLLVWLLLILGWFRRWWLRVWVVRFAELVVLDQDGKVFD